MSRAFLSILTLAAGLVIGSALPGIAQAAPAGTPCGDQMVVNTHGQCVKLNSFCSLSDGMILGSIGMDGRCVIPGTNISQRLD